MTKELTEEILQEISDNIYKTGEAITPFTAAPSNDASGAFVSSLTEAVMGNTSGLMAIASAIHNLAEAVRDHGDGNG